MDHTPTLQTKKHGPRSALSHASPFGLSLKWTYFCLAKEGSDTENPSPLSGNCCDNLDQVQVKIMYYLVVAVLLR